MKYQPPKLPLCHDVVWHDGSNYFSFPIMLAVIIEEGVGGSGGSSTKKANIFCWGRRKNGTIFKLAAIKKEVYLSHKNSRKENPVIIQP